MQNQTQLLQDIQTFCTAQYEKIKHKFNPKPLTKLAELEQFRDHKRQEIVDIFDAASKEFRYGLGGAYPDRNPSLVVALEPGDTCWPTVLFENDAFRIVNDLRTITLSTGEASPELLDEILSFCKSEYEDVRHKFSASPITREEAIENRMLKQNEVLDIFNAASKKFEFGNGGAWPAHETRPSRVLYIDSGHSEWVTVIFTRNQFTIDTWVKHSRTHQQS